ncbi:MAG TPA: ribokinase [Candidatus Anaerobutyricum avicola]|nr:ribokinase [Candidatus Anaerobutyricum avicola]
MAAKILMVGSIMMDLILQMPRIPHPSESLLGTTYSNAGGGKGSNSAVAAARAGGNVSVCGTLGQDANGEALLGMLKSAGINVSHLMLKEGANTGMAVIMLEENGMNRLAIYTGANNDTTPESVEAAFADDTYDALMMQLEIPFESNLRAFTLAKERGMITCLDAGPAQDYPIEKFQGITILSPNETETEALVGILPKDEESCIAASKILHERSGCKYVVLKMGEKGSFIYGEGICEMVPTFKVDAVDPTAAGDCFTGVLVKQYAETGDIVSSARYASAAAAISVQHLGAQPSLPEKEAIDAFLAERA